MSDKQFKNIYQEIIDNGNSIEQELIEIRRHLHMHPELSRKEYATADFIRKKIKELGDFTIHQTNYAGFAVDLVRDEKLPYIAIRADMDALPIQDKKNVPYSSKNKGICHACGHDFHTTVVFGILKTITKLRKYLSGNIRFIFQHAEEPIPGGALDFVKEGLLDNIDAVFGFHADPQIEAGKIAIRPGWNSAQSIHLKIKLSGEGGHSARPFLSRDLNYIGTNIIQEIYGAVYRFHNPEFPFVLTFGKINSGSNYNSLSEVFLAEGTLRVTREKQGDSLLNFIDKIVNYRAEEWKGIQTEFNFKKGAPPVWNDQELTDTMAVFFNEILDKSKFVNIFPSMGGEDFSHFLKKTKGVFINAGTAGKNSDYALHTPLFDIDEKAIRFIVNAYSYALIRYLIYLDHKQSN